MWNHWIDPSDVKATQTKKAVIKWWNEWRKLIGFWRPDEKNMGRNYHLAKKKNISIEELVEFTQKENVIPEVEIASLLELIFIAHQGIDPALLRW
jgi:hypothetical protein